MDYLNSFMNIFQLIIKQNYNSTENYLLKHVRKIMETMKYFFSPENAY